MVTQKKISSQEAAKQAQGYTDKPSNCGNCNFRNFTLELPAWQRASNEMNASPGGAPYYSIDLEGIETKQRCEFGNFPIKKTATCDQWRSKVAP